MYTSVNKLRRIVEFVDAPKDGASKFNLRCLLKRSSITVATTMNTKLSYREMLDEALADLSYDRASRAAEAPQPAQQAFTTPPPTDSVKLPCDHCSSKYHISANCFIKFPHKRTEYFSKQGQKRATTTYPTRGSR